MIVGEGFTDIKLDQDGQPIPDQSGQFQIVSDDECWKQDIYLEGQTEEGELFYEKAKGSERYGFGLLDFQQKEDDPDGFTRMEINQRIKSKLRKRPYLDSRKLKQEIKVNKKGFHISVTMSKQNAKDEYNVELSTGGVEVVDG